MSRIKKIKIRHGKPAHNRNIKHSAEDIKEAKKKKTGKIGTAVIAFILVASVIGYMWVSPDEVLEYGKFKFIKRENTWYNKEFRMEFEFHPLEIEDIPLEQSIKSKILNTYMLYFSYDLNGTYKESIARSIFVLQDYITNRKNIYTGLGSLTENNYNISIINCNNATNEIPVLVFKKSNTTGIMLSKENNNCIMIKSKTSVDFAKLKDRLLYSLLGVINN